MCAGSSGLMMQTKVSDKSTKYAKYQFQIQIQIILNLSIERNGIVKNIIKTIAIPIKKPLISLQIHSLERFLFA